MYEGIIRIVATAVVCAATGFILRFFVGACTQNQETRSEIELADILRQMGCDEQGSAWHFKSDGAMGTNAEDTFKTML